MTDEVSVALLEYLRKVGLGLEPDFVREAIRVRSEALMEREVSHKAGAARYERSGERTTSRNGYRLRTRATRVGGRPRAAHPQTAGGEVLPQPVGTAAPGGAGAGGSHPAGL